MPSTGGINGSIATALIAQRYVRLCAAPVQGPCSEAPKEVQLLHQAIFMAHLVHGRDSMAMHQPRNICCHGVGCHYAPMPCDWQRSAKAVSSLQLPDRHVKAGFAENLKGSTE